MLGPFDSSVPVPAPPPIDTQRKRRSSNPAAYGGHIVPLNCHGLRVVGRTEHDIIVNAGWTQRANGRGCTLYRDPDTGLWHRRAEALARLLRRPAGRLMAKITAEAMAPGGARVILRSAKLHNQPST
jgi:hypothetical protein